MCISAKKNMEIYHVNFADKICIEEGRVSLPQDIPIIDLIIKFKPEEDCGTVTICNTDQVWSYNVKEKAEATDVIENPEECMLHEEKVPEEAFLIQKKEIVDKDKVRELEQIGRAHV